MQHDPILVAALHSSTRYVLRLAAGMLSMFGARAQGTFLLSTWLSRARRLRVPARRRRARGSATGCALALVLLAIHAPPLAASENGYFGLLRARDLTPFGFLRLDMRPAHAVSGSSGAWGIETELAYQNTWALSSEVERYLKSLPERRQLGLDELDAIRSLPGENYLVDLELAEVNVRFHYKFSSHWGGYAALNGLWYGGGFLDRTIEQFHDTFGFGSFGRPAVARNEINAIIHLKSAQSAQLNAPAGNGLLDPTIGVRYSAVTEPEKWNVILEAAVKAALGGQRRFLSTGHSDFGVQATLQRFSKRQALYLSFAGVYYKGGSEFPQTGAKIVPTLVLGYERRLSAKTHLLVQGYVSPSIFSREETDLHELLATKYQLSIGFYRRIGRGLFSFAVTENLQNFNNTPDIGFQLGWAYSDALLSPGNRESP